MRLSIRSRSNPSKFGQLSDFARDLAARIEGKMARPAAGRGPRAVVRGEATRGRVARAAPAGGSLAGIADHVLAMKLAHPMEAIEVALLSQAMTDTHGNITAAARLLGIHRKAVERKLAKHRLASRRLAKQKVASKRAASVRKPARRKPARRASRG